MIDKPESIRTINEQIKIDNDMAYDWLNLVLNGIQYVIDFQVFVENFIQISVAIFKMRTSSPSQFETVLSVFVQICGTLLQNSNYTILILKTIVLAGTKSGIDPLDVAQTINELQEKGNCKQQLLQVCEIITHELIQESQISTLVMDHKFQDYFKKNILEKGVFGELVRFVLLCEKLYLIPGIQINIIQLICQLGTKLDLLKMSLENKHYTVIDAAIEQKQNFSLNLSIVHSLQALEEIFNKQINVQQIDDYELSQQILDKEIQDFLDKHPQMIIFLNKNFEIVLDQIVNCVLNILSQESQEFILDFVKSFLNTLLSTKTMYIQFIIFPLLELKEVQIYVIQTLFTNAFLNPNASFELSQVASCYLMSLLGRNTFIDISYTQKVLQVLLNQVFMWESIIEDLSESSASTLRYLLSIKCVMYIVVFIAPLIDDADLVASLKRFVYLNQTPYEMFPIVLDELLHAFASNSILEDEDLTVLAKINVKQQKMQLPTQLLEFYPFEPLEMQESQKWIEQYYRVLED